MSRMWIVEGDATSSGGRVVSCTPFTEIDGRGVARYGDQASCPRHQGTFPIVGGCDPTIIIDGQPVALHGAELSCGCKVLAISQMRVHVDAGIAAGATATAQRAVTAATGVAAHPHEHIPTHFNEGADGGSRAKASNAVQEANSALRSAGAYRPYDTEVQAAKAWREHVLPVADRHGVEIGALISRAGDGTFHLGGAYSAGAYDNCNGLLEHGQHTHGEVTAYVHTHPYPGGWVGKDRGFSWGQTLADTPGANLGPDIGSGDLVSAFSVEKNAYIADTDGLHGWIHDDYLKLLEQDRLRVVPLGEAYVTF